MSAAANPIGKLEIKVASCKNLKDVELVGKMSPYVHLKCGSEEFKTKVCDDAGKACSWNQNFIFNLDGKTIPEVHVLVYDKNTVRADAVIGRLDLKLDAFCKTHAEQRWQIFDPDNFSKIAGELYLQCVSYHGTVLTNQPPAAHPAPAPAPVAQPQPQVVMMAAPQMVMGAQPRVVYVQQPVVQQPNVVYVQQPAPQQVVYYQQSQS